MLFSCNCLQLLNANIKQFAMQLYVIACSILGNVYLDRIEQKIVLYYIWRCFTKFASYIVGNFFFLDFMQSSTIKIYEECIKLRTEITRASWLFFERNTTVEKQSLLINYSALSLTIRRRTMTSKRQKLLTHSAQVPPYCIRNKILIVVAFWATFRTGCMSLMYYFVSSMISKIMISDYSSTF